PKHRFEIAGDRNLFYRIAQLTVFDPQAGRAPGVVARYHVNTEAHHLGYIKARFDGADDIVWSIFARCEVKIRWRNSRRFADGSRGIAGGRQAQFFAAIS